MPCVVSTLKHCEVAFFEVMTYCKIASRGIDLRDEIIKVSEWRIDGLMRAREISHDT